MKSAIKMILLAGLFMIQPEGRAEDNPETPNAYPALELSADFPGGAAVPDRVGPVKHVDVSIPPKAGYAAWWYVRVDGITPGDFIQVNVKGNSATMPVYSLDNRNWRFYHPHIPVRIDGTEAWFAWYVPYTLSNALSRVKHAESACDAAKVFTLATTREGRPVPAVRVNGSDQPGSDRKVVWVQARAHAWEASSSWVADGFGEWLVSDDPVAERLRTQCDIVVVPIMDVDSVEKGAGGKGQAPQDHNRDWTASPHWPSVKAAQDSLKQFIKDDRLALFIDIHNPGWKGNGMDFWWIHDEKATALQTQNMEVFGRAIRDQLKTLGGRIADKGQYLKIKTDEPLLSVKWVTQYAPDSVLAFSLEVQMPPPRGYEGTPPDYHVKSGAELGRVLEQYLRETKQIPNP
jgi:hypothetical protein